LVKVSVRLTIWVAGVRRALRQFLADESGATAIEYGLICGMIAVVVLGISATGGAVSALWTKLAAIASAMGGSSPSPSPSP
jgi:pilus assembly protein Flp/PilA